MSNFLGDIGGNEPNRSPEREIQRVIFVEIENNEYGISTRGWRYIEESPGLTTSSNRLFDSVDEAIEGYLESKAKNK